MSAQVIIILNMVILLACWGILIFFIAPVAFPNLIKSIFKKGGSGKKSA